MILILLLRIRGGGMGESYYECKDLHVYISGSAYRVWVESWDDATGRRTGWPCSSLSPPPTPAPPHSHSISSGGDCCPGNSSYSFLLLLVLLSLSPHFPSFKVWLMSRLSNKLSPTIPVCTGFTFWELQPNYKRYCVIYLFIGTTLTKHSLVLFSF